MALKNSKRYQGEIMRNAGIFKVDQMELVARTSDPSDSDLDDARIYYNSGDKQFYGRLGGAFHGMTPGKQVVNSISTTTTLTEAQAGVILWSTASSARLTLPSASAEKGLTFTIVKVDSDVSGSEIYAATGDGIDTNSLTGIIPLTTIDAQGDMVSLVADGSGTWYFASRYIH